MFWIPPLSNYMRAQQAQPGFGFYPSPFQYATPFQPYTLPAPLPVQPAPYRQPAPPVQQPQDSILDDVIKLGFNIVYQVWLLNWEKNDPATAKAFKLSRMIAGSPQVSREGKNLAGFASFLLALYRLNQQSEESDN